MGELDSSGCLDSKLFHTIIATVDSTGTLFELVRTAEDSVGAKTASIRVVSKKVMPIFKLLKYIECIEQQISFHKVTNIKIPTVA